MKKNGAAYRSAEERPALSRPSGKDEVWIARDKRTGALLGPVIHKSAYGAKNRAAWLYAVPLDAVGIIHRSKAK